MPNSVCSKIRLSHAIASVSFWNTSDGENPPPHLHPGPLVWGMLPESGSPPRTARGQITSGLLKNMYVITLEKTTTLLSFNKEEHRLWKPDYSSSHVTEMRWMRGHMSHISYASSCSLFSYYGTSLQLKGVTRAPLCPLYVLRWF